MTTRTATAGAPLDRHGRPSALRRARPSEAEPAHRITSAQEPLEVDQARRMRRYLIEMGIRILCFIAAYFAWRYYPNPVLVIGLIVAAAVLPYIAVVGANAGRERGDAAGSYVTVAHRVLPTREDTAADDAADQSYGATHPWDGTRTMDRTIAPTVVEAVVRTDLGADSPGTAGGPHVDSQKQRPSRDAVPPTGVA